MNRSPFMQTRPQAGVGPLVLANPRNVSWKDVWYVDSAHSNAGDSAGKGLTPDTPFATLAYALTQMSAGDDVIIAPTHTETLTTATALNITTTGGASSGSLTGIRIIGCGQGQRRPTFTWAATDTQVVISADNVLITNIRCVVSVDEVVSMFSITGAGATLDAVDFYETSSKQAIQFLLTASTADDLEICNCKHYQNTAAAATQAWIKLVGSDRFYIHDNQFHLTLKDVATCAVINCATTACHDSVIARNFVRMTGYTANLVSAFLDSASSRILCVDNRIGADVAANTTINDCPSGWSFNTLCTNAVDKSGIVDPVVDS